MFYLRAFDGMASMILEASTPWGFPGALSLSTD
jgi:hypothetical protein